MATMSSISSLAPVRAAGCATGDIKKKILWVICAKTIPIESESIISEFGFVYHFDNFREDTADIIQGLKDVIVIKENVSLEHIETILLYQLIRGIKYYICNCDFNEDTSLYCEYKLTESIRS